jgi:ABC-type nitrate/sulfonate/bicarbonate transport system substrate-binding protein
MNPRTSFFKALLLLFSSLVFLGSVGCKPTQSQNESERIKLGWQPPWANQGQLVTILKRTDLLQRQQVQVDFVPFSYGGPMSEAAMAGQIDVMFAGEQPVLTLLSRSPDWRVAARLTRYRSAIVVPLSSPVKQLSDLRGKKIATAFGSTTHRDVIRILKEAGLIGSVKVVSLDQAEHASVIASGSSKQWGGGLAGIATYDPTIASGVSQGKARVLHSWASPALVAVREEFLRSHPDKLRGFLRAYRKAYVAYAANPKQANAWYAAESRLPLSDDDYAEIASFEPNLKARNIDEVDVRLTEEVLAEAERNAQIALEIGILKSKPDVRTASVTTLLE